MQGIDILMSTVHEAQTDAEIDACYPLMAQLRPHVPAEGFAALIRRVGPRGGPARGKSDERGSG